VLRPIYDSYAAAHIGKGGISQAAGSKAPLAPKNKIPIFMRWQSRERINWGIYTMQNDVYGHMARDVESDLVSYIMGLWHMEKMRNQAQNYSGAIKLKETLK